MLFKATKPTFTAEVFVGDNLVGMLRADGRHGGSKNRPTVTFQLTLLTRGGDKRATLTVPRHHSEQRVKDSFKITLADILGVAHSSNVHFRNSEFR